MKKYTTILFDADDTLLDFHGDEKRALIKVMEEYGVPVSDENCNCYSQINDGLWKRYEKGEIQKEDIKKTRFRLFFEHLQVEDGYDSLEVNNKYMTYLSGGGSTLEGATDLCRRLKEKGYDLYLVTNGTQWVQEPRLKKSGLLPYITEVFISDSIGYQKPRKEFFDKVFEDIAEKDKSRIILVGDSLSSDIKGAMNAGIDSVWFNPKGLPLPEGIRTDYVVKGFEEIEKIF